MNSSNVCEFHRMCSMDYYYVKQWLLCVRSTLCEAIQMNVLIGIVQFYRLGDLHFSHKTINITTIVNRLYLADISTAKNLTENIKIMLHNKANIKWLSCGQFIQFVCFVFFVFYLALPHVFHIYSMADRFT